jgi:putative ABC transport system permease protein
MNGAPVLDWWDLVAAAGLLLAAGGLSLGLKLGVARRLFWAAGRTVVQLTAVGFVLRFVFEGERAGLTAALAALMIVAASQASVQRSGRSFTGAIPLAFVALVLSSLATVWVVTEWVVGVDPWWTPRVMIPLLGMILGNGLTGISLCLDELLTRLTERAAEVEAELACGATRWEAARGPLREALRRGLIPIINSMTVAGLVSLPGMMTGQILAGASPFQAARYQIVVMFMIAAATSTGSILMALLVYRRLFNDRHQLRNERVRRLRG